MTSSEILKVPYVLSPTSKNSFKYFYPNHTIESILGEANHPHPLLAYERQYYENMIVSLIRDNDAYGWIVDIGGNAKRQDKNPLVWCCCPLIDSVDHARAARYTGLRNFCHHTFQECDCVNPASYICIHSLYYLSPDDVLAAVYRSSNKVLYSLHHEFDNAYGSFANGEAKYRMVNSKMVHMNTEGNSYTYTHDPIHWLKSGFYTNSVRAITWTKIFTGPHSVVFKFIPCPAQTKAVPFMHLSFSSALSNATYYGDVKFSGAGFSGAFNDSTKTLFGEHAISLESLYSVGQSFISAGSDSEVFVAPKTFVCELSARAVGKPRDATTFTNLLHTARDMIRSYDVPSELIPRALVLSTHLAFINTMDLEISSLHTLLDNHRKFSVLNEMMSKFVRIRIWDPAMAFRLIIVAILFVYAKYYRHLRFRSHVSLAAFMCVSAFICYKYPISLSGSVMDLLNIRHFSRSNPITFVTEPTSVFSLTSIDLNPKNLIARFWKTVRGLIHFETNDKAIELSKAPTYIVKDVKTGRATDCLTAVGIVDPAVAPIVYAATQNNETISVVNRGIAISKEADYLTVEHFCQQMPIIVSMILPIKMVETNFIYWNNRYPIGVRDRHLAVYNAIRGCSNYEDLDLRIKAFVKREKQLLISSDFDDKDPRLISGRSDGFNVTTGPFCLAMSNYMIAELTKRKRLFYAAGSTCDDIGEWFAQVGHNNPLYTYIESDGNRYDANQLPSLCHARVDCYANYTSNSFMISIMQRDVSRKSGRTPHGVHYRVSGTMPSGSGDTSFGNSLLNLSSNIASIAHQTGKEYIEILFSIYMAVMGDDNVLIVPSSYPKLSNLYLNGTGMKIAMVYRPNSFDLTFCSSYFYPVQNGYCLGPKIGRFLPKFGWYVDVPRPHLYSTHLATIQSIERDISFIEPLHMVVQKQKKLLLEKFVRPRRIPKSYNFHVVKPQTASDDTKHFLNYHYNWDENFRSSLQNELDKVTSLPSFISSLVYEPFIKHDGEVAKYNGIITASVFDIVQYVDRFTRGISADPLYTIPTVELGLAVMTFFDLNSVLTDCLHLVDVLLNLYRCLLYMPLSQQEVINVLLNVIGEEFAKRAIPDGTSALASLEFGLNLGTLAKNRPLHWEWYLMRRILCFIKHYNWTKTSFTQGVLSHFMHNMACPALMLQVQAL